MNARFLLRGLAMAMALFASPAMAADLAGTWAGHITDPSGVAHDISLNLKAAGNTVTGSMTGGPPDGSEQPIANGKLDGDQLSFEVKAQGPGGPVTLSYSGKVSGDQLKGSTESPMGSLPWEATRK